MKTLGLIATFKGGLGSLRAAGQDERLIQNYFQTYAQTFDRLYYFSYLDERLEDFTQDPELLKKVRLFPKKSKLPSLLYAFWMPFAYSQAFKECAVFRVFQSIGILPLWRYFFRPPLSLVTYGYRYAQFARVEGKSFFKVFFIKLTEWLALRMASVMLVTTPELYRYISKKRGAKSVLLIPNGVDTNQFRPLEPDAVKSPESSHVPMLLFVGRLEKQKNLSHLIEAASIVATQQPVNLLWIGRGSLEGELRALAEKYHVNLTIRPPIPHAQLAQIMREADVFTLVSWTEGHPKVLLEAMASGIACLVSNAPGNRELVQQGITGLVCEPGDANAMAERLGELLNNADLRRRLGQAARAFIQKDYQLPLWIKRETEILNRLANGQWPGVKQRKGLGFTAWLDYSIRRQLLDRDVNKAALFLRGRVLEVGGGQAIQRGRFVRPVWQCFSWTTLNLTPESHPDIIGDVHHLPFGDYSFESVLCLEVLEYLENPRLAFQEIKRVLLKGGYLLLSWPYGHPRDHAADRWRFTETDVEHMLLEAGFSIDHMWAQGNLFTSSAHRLKWHVTQIRTGWLRQIMAALSFIPIELLGVFKCSAKTPTGYFCVARLI